MDDPGRRFIENRYHEPPTKPRSAHNPDSADGYWEGFPLDEAIPKRPGLVVRVLHFLAEALQTVLIAGVLFLLVNLITARIRVESVSMQPNLFEGEYVVVNRLAYLLTEPERGDIIVFRFPLDPSRRYIKRVIGLPGDTIVAKGGEIYVNEVQLTEPYLATEVTYEGEWIVPAENLFVLGDNRNNSLDSKNWGNLPFDNVIGKAILVYWPPSELGLIPHYNLGVER